MLNHDAPTVLARLNGAAIFALQGGLLGHLIFKLTTGSLRDASPGAHSSFDKLKGLSIVALGGSVGTSSYGQHALRREAEHQMTALLKGKTVPRFLVSMQPSHDQGAMGTWYAHSEREIRSSVALARSFDRRGLTPVVTLVDVGATKTHVLSAEIEARSLSLGKIVERTTVPTLRQSPRPFYQSIASAVVPHLEIGRPYEAVPTVFMGHPGDFSSPLSPIGRNSARNLGRRKGEFSGVSPSELLNAALSSQGRKGVEILVCNDGRAQLAAILQRKEELTVVERHLSAQIIYLGLGTGLGFAAAAVPAATDPNFYEVVPFIETAALGPTAVDPIWLANAIRDLEIEFLDIGSLVQRCKCWGDILSGQFLQVCMTLTNEMASSSGQIIYSDTQPKGLNELLSGQLRAKS